MTCRFRYRSISLAAGLTVAVSFAMLAAFMRSAPASDDMKGGFRHDPYQSGNLHTPCRKRAYLGAHATAPIIYIDELKTLIKMNYMADLLEFMQNQQYILEGGKNAGSGAADCSENPLRAQNLVVACCNHDTLAYLQEEGDGAFLSRIEDKGEVVQMESAVAETPQTVQHVARYVKQEILNLGRDFQRAWGEVIAQEGYESVRRRSEHIFGRCLPADFRQVIADAWEGLRFTWEPLPDAMRQVAEDAHALGVLEEAPAGVLGIYRLDPLGEVLDDEDLPPVEVPG